jgi:D-alanyl-D-alanine carboxypeptidase
MAAMQEDAAIASSQQEPDRPLPTPAPEILVPRLEAYLQPFLDAGHLSGNLLVAQGDQVILERSFGMASYELMVPIAPETRFNIASVTKPMTVALLIRLAEDGKISLEDPLSKYIPEFPRATEITVAHLARHRAGIPHRVTDDSQQTVPHSAADMVEFAALKPLAFEPGAEHSYSSGGFSVLARVLELAGGASYGELLERYVFLPTGMTHTSHADRRQVLPGRASSYVLNARGQIVNTPLEDLSYLVGAGSVFSTARDLRTLLVAARQGVLGEGARASFVDENGINWNGIAGGYRAFADWHKSSDATVVFTANLHTGAGDRLRADLPRIMAGEDVPLPVLPQVKPVELAEATLRSYEGIYELRPGSDLRVSMVDGGLMVNSYTLVPTGDQLFYSPQDYGVVTVVMGEDGFPLRLDWKIGEDTYPCPRTGDL